MVRTEGSIPARSERDVQRHFAGCSLAYEISCKLAFGIFEKKRGFPAFFCRRNGSSKWENIQALWGTVSTDPYSCHLCPARRTVINSSLNPNINN